MEKSKIWHDMGERPATQYVKIYILNEDNYIYLITYNHSYISWEKLDEYLGCDIVAWAYVADIVNL